MEEEDEKEMLALFRSSRTNWIKFETNCFISKSIFI